MRTVLEDTSSEISFDIADALWFFSTLETWYLEESLLNSEGIAAKSMDIFPLGSIL